VHAFRTWDFTLHKTSIAATLHCEKPEFHRKCTDPVGHLLSHCMLSPTACCVIHSIQGPLACIFSNVVFVARWPVCLFRAHNVFVIFD